MLGEPVPSSTSPSALISIPAPLPEPAKAIDPTAPPTINSLAKVFTVADVWREWKEGHGGQLAIQKLEDQWGSRWRPGGTIRVQFCRRKIIWDAVSSRIARGKSEAEAVAEVERLRDGGSLNRLVDTLKQRRQQRRNA